MHQLSAMGVNSGLLLALTFAAACGDDSAKDPVVAEPGPFCLLGTLPFSLSDTDWRLADNEEQAKLRTRIKHQPADILSNGQDYAYTDASGTASMSSGTYVVRGVMARTKQSQGLTSIPIPGELVSLWGQEGETWNERGAANTADRESSAPGAYSIDLGTSSIEGESRNEYAVLNAESSCGAHVIYELSPGRQVVLADIDETITLSDEEIFLQIPDESYDQRKREYSVELTQAWADKGYQMIYLTARPHVFRAETRAWLTHHGYAQGPIITAPELVLGDSARQYKLEWTSRLIDDLSWDIVAAYGNSESDIEAYAEAGLDKAITFIIGESAGALDTVAIENNSYQAHIENYVLPQPDAAAP